VFGGCGEDDAAGEGRLRVTAASGCCEAEGSAQALRITGPDGETVADARFDADGGPLYAGSVPAGRYRVETWAEPCAAGCEAVGQPSDACTTDVDVVEDADTTVQIAIQPVVSCDLLAFVPNAER
jgi:hypothetical protein